MAASDVVYVGSGIIGRLVEGLDHTIEVDETGVSSAELTYHCIWTEATRLIRTVTRHPDFNWLLKKKATISRRPGNIAEVRITFKGVDPEQGTSSEGGESGEIVTFSIENAANAEPIETHPDFDTFAGEWDDPSTWANGATFSPKGVFEGFAAGSPKSGVKSFLNPGLVYVRTRVIPKLASGMNLSQADLGKRVAALPASAIRPTMAAGVDFLKISAEIELVGEGVRIVEKWKSSGPNGWDTDIYEAA